MKTAMDIKIKNFGNKIEFTYPNETLAISTTSSECTLSCAHFNGHYLKNMTHINEYRSKIKGEYEVINYLSKNPSKKITFIVLIPTKGTEYEKVADILCEARINMTIIESKECCVL